MCTAIVAKFGLLALLATLPAEAFAGSTDRDLAIGILLADEAAVGKIESVCAADPDAEWTVHRVAATIDGKQFELSLSASREWDVDSIKGEDKVVLFNTRPERPGTATLLRWPKISAYDRAALNDVDLALFVDRVRSAAASVRASDADCPRDFKKRVTALDKRNQSKHVAELYAARPLKLAELKCVVASIASKAPLAESSFAPPYASSEGVFHHGYPTRGDLVAALLPHLTGVSIYPNTFPMNDKERNKLVDAWSFWATRNSSDAATTE